MILLAGKAVPSPFGTTTGNRQHELDNTKTRREMLVDYHGTVCQEVNCLNCLFTSYSNSTSKILLYPKPSNFTKPSQQQRTDLDTMPSKTGLSTWATTLKLSKSGWRRPKSQNGVEARLIALDLIRAMYAAGHTLHCGADLSRRGYAPGGCLILSNGSPSTPTEVRSCLCFAAWNGYYLFTICTRA